MIKAQKLIFSAVSIKLPLCYKRGTSQTFQALEPMPCRFQGINHKNKQHVSQGPTGNIAATLLQLKPYAYD